MDKGQNSSTSSADPLLLDAAAAAAVAIGSDVGVAAAQQDEDSPAQHLTQPLASSSLQVIENTSAAAAAAAAATGTATSASCREEDDGDDGTMMIQEGGGGAGVFRPEVNFNMAVAAAPQQTPKMQRQDSFLSHSHNSHHPSHEASMMKMRGASTSALPPAYAAAAPPSSTNTSTNRSNHVLVDPESGLERTFGSALGLLTRKFVCLVQSSYRGSVYINECASLLQVPKRRIYDITNVLEGIGLLEKRSKNMYRWKSSEQLLGDTLDAEAKSQLQRVRAIISSQIKEDGLLDDWMDYLLRQHSSGQALSADAAGTTVTARSVAPVTSASSSSSSSSASCAPFLPVDDALCAIFAEDPRREVLVDSSTGRPRRALLAIHPTAAGCQPHNKHRLPFNGGRSGTSGVVAFIPVPANRSQQERQLYVGTRAGMLSEHPFGCRQGVFAHQDGDDGGHAAGIYNCFEPSFADASATAASYAYMDALAADDAEADAAATGGDSAISSPGSKRKGAAQDFGGGGSSKQPRLAWPSFTAATSAAGYSAAPPNPCTLEVYVVPTYFDEYSSFLRCPGVRRLEATVAAGAETSRTAPTTAATEASGAAGKGSYEDSDAAAAL